jgi:hypothetical protein
MGVRTVRLDEESERILRDLQATTGMSISEVLKQGLIALRESGPPQSTRTPYAVYRALDLGPGGYSAAPAARAKQAVHDAIRRKHQR